MAVFALVVYWVTCACYCLTASNDRAKLSLAGLGVAFGKLFDAYNDTDFNDARSAVVVLGSQLKLDAAAIMYFKGHLRASNEAQASVPSLGDAVAVMKTAIVKASSYTSDQTALERIGDPLRMTFDGIVRILRNATRVTKKAP